MTPAELLNGLRARGVVLGVHDGRLRVDAPIGVITPELRELLAVHKTELLTLLTPTRKPTRPARPPFAYCQRHTSFWRHAELAKDYWVCGVCHPPDDGQMVDWW